MAGEGMLIRKLEQNGAPPMFICLVLLLWWSGRLQFSQDQTLVQRAMGGRNAPLNRQQQ